MRNRKAFTLVELLVVIAIIALLISILVPSLKSARDLAKELFCKTNLNAINKSVAVYSELNRGFMPVFQHSSPSNGLETLIGASEGPMQVYKTFTAFKGNADQSWEGPVRAGDSHSTGIKDGLFADQKCFGIIYALKLLEPAEMFYCPMQKEAKNTRSWYGTENPWGSYIPDAGPAGTDFVRISYMYNPWVIYDPTNSPKDMLYEDQLVSAKHPTDRFITGDIITSMDNISHFQGNIYKWNFAYQDGHVATKSEKDTKNPQTANSIISFFSRLVTAGQSADQWRFWGYNNAGNTQPMGQHLNPNGSIRYELLNKTE